MPEFCKRLMVPRSRLMLDLGKITIWCLLGGGLFIAVHHDRNVTKGLLWLELVPLLFFSLSARDFLNHIRAGEIRLQKEGLEIPGERGRQLLEWKNVEQVRENRSNSGGLTVYGRKRERIFIPRVVKSYGEIRAYILQMTGGQPSGTTTGS